MGPSLIFDKSTLESLSLDDSVWLDHFFRTVVTPLFFIETLADLEKAVHSGRTAEQVVGHIARRTPDMNSYPAIHHRKLLDLELSGTNKIAMDGRPVISGGKSVKLNDSKGLIFSKTEEEEAFFRWQRGDFLDLERQMAKFWRRAVCDVDYAEAYIFFQRFFSNGRKPRDLAEAKSLADSYIDMPNREQSLKFGLSLLAYSPEIQNNVLARWKQGGQLKLREFAPYFSHVYCVELFFYLAIAADLISRVRPDGKANNKVDICYLYYLPLCHLFTSNDNLHARAAPLFMRSNQSFIRGSELKAGLQEVDSHYAALSSQVKAQGLHRFARLPPTDTTFFVTQMWDLYVPKWRTSAAPVDLSEDLQKTLMDLAKRFQDKSQPSKPGEQYTTADANFVQIQRTISPQKGKWRRVPPGAENQK